MSNLQKIVKKYSYQQWLAEGDRLFGLNKASWEFVCPVCGHLAKPKDWIIAGASKRQVAFLCIQEGCLLSFKYHRFYGLTKEDINDYKSVEIFKDGGSDRFLDFALNEGRGQRADDKRK